MLITNLKIAEYLVKKWEFIVAIKKWKKNCSHEDYVGEKNVCGDVYV